MSLAIFTEGTTSTDPANNSFLDLWGFLAARAGAATRPLIRGFSKASLVWLRNQGLSGTSLCVSTNPVQNVALDVPRVNLQGTHDQLDRTIELAYADSPFERLIIAFDREPKHNALKVKCRRAEMIVVLTNLAASTYLPPNFRAAARTLLNGYLSRAPARPQKNLPLEILVMERVFEDMILCDEPGVRNALGLNSYPKEWPSFKNPTPKSDEHIFKNACRCASPAVHALVRDPTYKDKHKWAKFILQNLPSTSLVWRHDIFVRLRSLV